MAWLAFAGLVIGAGLLLAGCEGGTPRPAPTPTPSPTPTPAPVPVAIASSFANGFDGWQPAYSDYTPGQEATIGFTSGHEQLPAPMAAESGVFLASDNRADDVFMYLWRPVTGLTPNRRYRVEVALAIATDAPPGCFGAGGAPGESVQIKAGAAPRAPANVLVDGRITTNFDKGEQFESGTDVVIIGDLAQPIPGDDCFAPSYQRKALSAAPASAPILTTDASGRLWLVIGTDSGYEGTTRAYFLGVAALLTPV